MQHSGQVIWELLFTPFGLKIGKNEIKMFSERVKYSFRVNDITCSIGGPDEWYADLDQIMLRHS